MSDFAPGTELRKPPVSDPIITWMEGIERDEIQRAFAIHEALFGDCAARTAAGQQSPSQVSLSRRSRVTIDYRKGEKK